MWNSAKGSGLRAPPVVAPESKAGHCFQLLFSFSVYIFCFSPTSGRKNKIYKTYIHFPIFHEEAIIHTLFYTSIDEVLYGGISQEYVKPMKQFQTKNKPPMYSVTARA